MAREQIRIFLITMCARWNRPSFMERSETR